MSNAQSSYQALSSASEFPASTTAPRYRGVLSCDLCRQRNAGPQPKPVQKERKVVNDSLQRIRRLEELVLSLASNASSTSLASSTADSRKSADMGASRGVSLSNGTISNSSTETRDLASNLGKIRIDGDQIVYISAAHWATIQDEVRSIREDLGDIVPDFNDRSLIDDTYRGPLLLRGISKPLSIEEILESMPAKPIVDLLVSRFFTSSQPSIVLLHTIEFQKQYTCFWSNPSDINLSWLSILFGILSISIHLHQQAGDTIPKALGPANQAMNTLHLKATQCLLLANYLKPTTYTIEALLINIQQEFLRSIDIDDSLWVMAATIVRLAMKAGYHRDPAAHTQISPFRGEMRRRAWALLVQLDILVSNQFGLPRMLVSDQFDTRPPRNLLDEDFDEHCTALPPGRPDAVYTPVSFTIAKGRILEVLAEIVNRSTSVRSSTYEEVMTLDTDLNKAYIDVPLPLKLTSESAIAVPHPVLIRRYLLELLYQKARLLLHRGSMEKAQEDSKYGRSSAICVDAAMKLLGYQEAIHRQVREGGLLQRDKWFLWSLEQNDFVLAAMIISLELSFILKRQDGYRPPTDELGRVAYDQKAMLQALHISHGVWTDASNQSKVASQAAETLANVLQKAGGNLTSVTDAGQTSQIASSAASKHEIQALFAQKDCPQGELFDFLHWDEGFPETFDSSMNTAWPDCEISTDLK